jgi:membrane protease YdiL (CAAX protease family)
VGIATQYASYFVSTMADSNATNDPPLVTRVEPPVPAKPRPGLGESLLWCLAFWAVLLFCTLGTTAGVLLAYSFKADNRGQFFLDQLNGFAAALTPLGPGKPPPPPMPVEFGNAIAYGMLGGQIGTLAFVLFLIPRRVGPDWKRQLGLRTPAAMHVFLVILVVPGLIVLAEGFQELFTYLTGITSPPTEVLLKGTLQNLPWAVTLGAVALGPGLVEELWCRGFLGRGLCARYGLKWGVVLTSAIFAALHLSLAQFLVFMLMGSYLHFVYLASRSLWVPILLHLLNNGIATLAVLQPDLYALWERFGADAKGLRRIMELASLGLLVFASVAMWTGRAEVIEPRVADDWAGEEDWEPEYPGISAPPENSPAQLSYAPISPAAVVLALGSFGILLYLFGQLAT